MKETVEQIAEKEFPYNDKRTDYATEECREIFKLGYKKCLQTYQFGAEDMIEFAEWKGKEKFEWNIRYNNWTSQYIEYSGCVYTTKELLQLWQEQKTKTVWYD